MRYPYQVRNEEEYFSDIPTKDPRKTCWSLLRTSSRRALSPLPRSSNQGGPRKRFGQPVSTKSDGERRAFDFTPVLRFRTPVLLRASRRTFALQSASNHTLHNTRAEASTRGRLDERAVRLGPAEDEPSICRARPLDLDVAFGPITPHTWRRWSPAHARSPTRSAASHGLAAPRCYSMKPKFLKFVP